MKIGWGTWEGGFLLPLRLRGAGHALRVLFMCGLQDDAEAARAAPSKKTVWIPSTADTSLFCQGVRVRVLPPSVVSWEAAGSQRRSCFKASAKKEGPLAPCPPAGLRDSRAQLANAKMALSTWPQLPVHALTIHPLNRPSAACPCIDCPCKGPVLSCPSSDSSYTDLILSYPSTH